MQLAAIIVIAALAIVYIVLRKLGVIKNGSSSCGYGCSKCSSAGGCCESSPHVEQDKAGSAKATASTKAR